jgi:hypothetical protein
MLRRFSIRLRMQGAIAIVLVLFVLVGAAALLGGGRQLMVAQRGLHGALGQGEAQHVSDLRASLGHVRQHEKNMVIDYEDGVKVLAHREAWLKRSPKR